MSAKRRGGLRNLWVHRRWLWRNRRSIFDPVRRLAASEGLDALTRESLAWCEDKTRNATALAAAAERFAFEAEHHAIPDGDSSAWFDRGLLLRTLATGARRVETAANQLAVAQLQDRADLPAAAVELEVAISRLQVSLRELVERVT